MSLLEIKDLSVSFKQYSQGLQQEVLEVIKKLDLIVNKGEILTVVGSSGSGKSLLAHAILGILPTNAKISGSMYYDGKGLSPKMQKKLRGREIAFVTQSVNFLNPLTRVGTQVRTSVKSGNALKTQQMVFDRYHLNKKVERLYPFQLSGGMARRVLVSTAVVSGANLIIADVSTPGLHPEVLEETLNHFRDLADEGKAVMLITHDIDTALRITDKIAVFYAGTTVETAAASDFAGQGEALRHPYSKALWNALPQNGFNPLTGSKVISNSLAQGCFFAPLCTLSTPECKHKNIDNRKLRGGLVRCINAA